MAHSPRGRPIHSSRNRTRTERRRREDFQANFSRLISFSENPGYSHSSVENQSSPSRNQRQMRRLPSRQPAGNLHHVIDSRLVQKTSRNRRTIPARAMHGNAAIARNLAHALLQVTQRKVYAARN